METIWLQRPSADIPWGFRLQGGRDFNQPLSVHRVSPGSVASNGLTPGDVILKIGNVNATSLSHTDAQDVIRGASNILQFTIKKGSTVSAPVSPTYTPPQYTGSQQSGYGSYDQSDPSANYPDYRVGSGYSDLGYNSVSSSGYNTLQGNSSPYSAGPQYSQAPAMSGYSTLPARGTSRQNSESFRSVQQQPQLQQQQQQPQNKYPYKTTAGIQLHVNPQVQSSPQPPYNEGMSQSQPMSPVQYQNDYQSQSPYQRQTSVGSNSSYPASYYKKPTPFSPGVANQNGSTTPPPRLQRQKSQGSTHEATVTQGFQPGTYLPKSDDAPPPPPPPVNYRQPEPYGRSPYDQEPSPSPYQRQSSQPQQGTPYQRQGSYGQQSPYDSYNQQQQPQSGMYVDTSPNPAQQFQRQGSLQSDYNSGPKSYPQSPASYQRQPSYGSQSYQSAPPPPPPQYESPYAPATPTQSYSRQQSRDQIQSPSYSKPTSPPSSGTGINSFDDILSPFEKFQNSNYCDKLFSRDNRDVDSGVMSDLSEPSYQSQSLSSDTPRSNQSSFSSYSPPQPAYPGGYGNTAPQSQNLLRPAPQAPPPPPITPPPPPPPPPPSNWTPSPRRTPAHENGQSGDPQQQQMPDKVLNTMLKNAGTQKPFSYVPTGLDLQKFKDKARQRNQPRSVMPRGYAGPDLDAEELQGGAESPKPKAPGAAPNPESGVYRHAQYNSPLRMYSSDNARDALNAQSGGGVDVSGLNNNYYCPPRNPQQFITVPQKTVRTPERRPSDIKESEVYRMCQEADAKGYKPKKPRNPLLRHNSEDDEMRFTGLHSKADIPSKIFQRLNKLTVSGDTPDAPTGQTSGKQADDEEPERVGNYDEASIRYRGNYIPSPSFRLLQSLAKEDKQQTPSPGRTDDEDDGLPDQLPEEDMVDKRYKGGHIPSKIFKALQMQVGDDSNETEGTPVKPSEGGGSRIKVISKSKPMSPKTVPRGTDSPKTVEHPSTDF